jgi:N-acylmannosamine kinase
VVRRRAFKQPLFDSRGDVMIAALDIGGTKISAGLFCEGRCLGRRITTTPSQDPNALVAAAALLLEGWTYSAIGVATTGYVAEGRVYSVNRDTLADWHGFALEAALRSRLDFAGEMLLLNDAAAAAWAEFKARPSSSGRLAFATVSTGVGGGLVLDGALLESPRGLAGHLGHMRVAESGLCGCGRVGCVEAVASGTAIAWAAGDRLGHAITAREVLERAETDPVCREVAEASAKAMAELSGDLRMLLETDILVIGGSVGLAPGYIERVRRYVGQLPAAARSKIEPALHAEDAGLVGVHLRLAERMRGIS